MTECCGIWGRLFGHKMESLAVKIAPPADIPLADGDQIARVVLAVIDKYTTKEFRIVCIRCGMEPR